MIRCFVALPLPDALTDAIDDIQTGLRGANWQPEENMHLTLAFLGDQDRHSLSDLDLCLAEIRAAPVDLHLRGVSHFGGRDPRLVFVGVDPNPTLMHLQNKVETAVRAAGIDLPGKRFVPHVTLARWGRGAVQAEALQAYVEANNLFQAKAAEIDAFALFRSDLNKHGARYTEMARYPLQQ
ncbi:MAG: RNA 2',3'-cyclic phosphodiesterase [Pseudomonadota bacterium]